LRVAPDFVLVRTTRRALDDFLGQYDISELRAHFARGWFRPEERLLIAGSGSVSGTKPGTLLVFDSELQARLELQIEPGAGYINGPAAEFPRKGLQVTRIWAESEDGKLEEREVRQEDIWLRPRE